MLLRSADRVPGGPLFSIECSQGSICQLHLPHCEPDPGKRAAVTTPTKDAFHFSVVETGTNSFRRVFTAPVSESLSVVHVTDDGFSMIQPLEITATHVVVDTPHLSAFGIVWNVISRFVSYMTQPVSGQVLLFLRPTRRGGNLILNVLLLPSNVPLQEVKPSPHHGSPTVIKDKSGQTMSVCTALTKSQTCRLFCVISI